MAEITAVKTGDITQGHYEQDGDLFHGTEAIERQVLTVEGDHPNGRVESYGFPVRNFIVMVSPVFWLDL